MGVYAHRFIEVLDKDNHWHLLPLWSKYKESSYSQPDLVTILPMPFTTATCS